MPHLQNSHKGKSGEDIAKHFLQKKGYQIVAHNFHSYFGEIDLIAVYKGVLIFVEVKTRTSDLFGRPEEAVGYRKLQAISKTGEYFKSLHPKLPSAMQIDVVAVTLAKSNEVSIEHLKNVTG